MRIRIITKMVWVGGKMKKVIPDKSLVNVSIKKGLITITFGFDYLKHVAENAPDLEVVNYETGKFIPAKVTDQNVFAREIVEAILEEEEDGTNLVHKMIDTAIHNKTEYGCEGIDIFEGDN